MKKISLPRTTRARVIGASLLVGMGASVIPIASALSTPSALCDTVGRCCPGEVGLLSGPVHANVESLVSAYLDPYAPGVSSNVHDLNCAELVPLGL